MNPLLKHPVLSSLPYKELMHPSLVGIKEQLKKKRAMLGSIAVGLVIAAVGMLVIGLSDLRSQGPSAAADKFIVSAIAAYSGFFTYSLRRKFLVPDSEIQSVLAEFEGQNGVG
jgi:hypothetical protein